MFMAVSYYYSSLGISNIYSQALSRPTNNIPSIYIISLVYIRAVVLLTAITGFPIKNSLVISFMMGRPV